MTQEGIVTAVFNEWTTSIRDYMREHKKTEASKVTDLDFKTILEVIDMRQRQIIAEIEKESYLTHYRKRSIGLIELIGDNKK